MSEEYEEDGTILVRVRAQVMMRDDHTGGWVPWAGGGLANVFIRRRPLTSTEQVDNCKNEYLIIGRRILETSKDIESDNEEEDEEEPIVLSCNIRKDFEYNKVMPTFHHWKTDDKKFGLTFQTAADARAFDKGVRTAMEDLLDGSSILQKLYPEGGDDDVFMTLNLPVERGDPFFSSDSSNNGNNGSGRYPPPVPPPMEPHHLHRIHYVPRREKPESELEIIHVDKKGAKDKESYSYVELTSLHDYMYPTLEDRDPTDILKKPTLETHDQPPLPRKKSERPKSCPRLCHHCQKFYIEEENVRGSCEYAPDRFRAGIRRVTCIRAAEGLMYHCMADSEGEIEGEPCDCGPIDGRCTRKWVGLTLLSLLIPCLWCYPPLNACHWCCLSCGICGGRHEESSS